MVDTLGGRGVVLRVRMFGRLYRLRAWAKEGNLVMQIPEVVVTDLVGRRIRLSERLGSVCSLESASLDPANTTREARAAMANQKLWYYRAAPLGTAFAAVLTDVEFVG